MMLLLGPCDLRRTHGSCNNGVHGAVPDYQYNMILVPAVNDRISRTSFLKMGRDDFEKNEVG